MNRMMLVVDVDLERELIAKGFKIIKKDSNGTIFGLDNKLKFNFEEVDKNKYTFINRLVF